MEEVVQRAVLDRLADAGAAAVRLDARQFGRPEELDDGRVAR